MTNGGGIDVSPDFSPDGKSIAFASERSGGSQVYMMPGQRRRRRSGSRSSGDFNIDPVISPDGKKLRVRRPVARAGSTSTSPTSTAERGPGTQDMGDNEDPSWSPDSNYLVFSSTRTGRSELWISTADGRHQHASRAPAGWTQPTFVPMAREPTT